MTGTTERPPKKRRKGGNNNRRTSRYYFWKVCSRCGENKRLSEYYIRGDMRRKKKASDPYRYKEKCKDCYKQPSAVDVDPDFKPDRTRIVFDDQSPEAKRQRARDRKARTRRETRIAALQYVAEKGCCCCGIRDPRVLEFDHINGEDKKYNIADLLSNGFSWRAPTLQQELRKCRVICANCHRLHTVEQQRQYSHEDVQEALWEILDAHGIPDAGA